MATRGARQAGLLAICPAAGPAGEWWRREYRGTIRESVAYLRRRGVEHVYLGGLSNGGIGASRIAPLRARELDLAGLILISGVASNGGTGGVPALIVQGRDDDMTPASHARALVDRARPRPDYVELPGSHFLLAERLDAVSAAVRDWLRRRNELIRPAR
jgi:pimeloyl-ACP methyl ester carboxylesterase